MMFVTPPVYIYSLAKLKILLLIIFKAMAYILYIALSCFYWWGY